MKTKSRLRSGSTDLPSVMAAILMLTVAGCSRKSEVPTVTLGSKNFTEQLILGELMAEMVEARTDLRVQRRFNLGGTMICHTALTKGEIDLYAEYTGTALTAILKQPVAPDPDNVYRIVSQAYAKRFACEWLNPFGFNNTYAITVRRAFADENGVRQISDLKPLAPNLKAGFTAEFAVREDGYPGLADAYGFSFGSSRDMDPSLMYKAVAQKEVDAICAFATDGRIAAYELTTLDDDKGFFPPYYAAPVARSDTLARHPEIRDALAPLAGELDDETMRKLNFQVDEQKREPAEVAREFLVSKNLITASRNQ